MTRDTKASRHAAISMTWQCVHVGDLMSWSERMEGVRTCHPFNILHTGQQIDDLAGKLVGARHVIRVSQP